MLLHSLGVRRYHELAADACVHAWDRPGERMHRFVEVAAAQQVRECLHRLAL